MSDSEEIRSGFEACMEEAKALLAYVPGDVAVLCVSDGVSDPWFEIDGTGYGVCVVPSEDEEEIASGNPVEFVIYKTAYDPGVRYHADGSGTPPSADPIDLWTMTDARVAAEALVRYYCEKLFVHAQNALGEDRMAAEQAAVERSYEEAGR